MAKRQVKNKRPSQVWKKYKVVGDKLKKALTCPKCGNSYFLAIHKDRITCGKCSYTEFSKR